MKYYAAGTLCALSLCAVSHAGEHNLVDNLTYRLTWGDLDPFAATAENGTTSARLVDGSEDLLRACLEDRKKWHKDPLIFRLAHGHPLSTIGCRERTSPSLHVVFYKLQDGSREAWVHFDLFGPNNIAGHLGEVLRNRMTLGRTSNGEVYRSLVSFRHDHEAELPPTDYDYTAHLKQYLSTTFGPAPLLSAIGTGTARAMLTDSSKWGTGASRYERHIEANFARNTVQQSIEFGASALLRQDEKYVLSQEQSFGGRLRSAVWHTFFVPGRNGDEFAFPRVAAAFGTAYLESKWHPWRTGRSDPWLEASTILSKYVARSVWQEFKPDIKNRFIRTSRFTRVSRDREGAQLLASRH